MKVKKGLLVAVVSLLTTCFCMIPFSNEVKAATALTPVTTTVYGSYYAETYYDWSVDGPFQEFEINLPFVTVGLSNDVASVFHLHYDFANTQNGTTGYSGTIQINVITPYAYKLNDSTILVDGGYFVTVPTKTTNSTSKTFTIGLYQATEMDFYIIHDKLTTITNPIFNSNVTYNLVYDIEYVENEVDYLMDIRTVNGNIYDFMTDDMVDTLSNILTTTEDISDSIEQVYINEKYMPFRNLSAYVWGLSYGSYSPMTPFEFPCINYLKADNNESYDLSHRITKQIGKDVVIYYLTTTYILNSNINIYTWSGNTLNKLNTQLMNYNVINGTYLYLNKLTISGDNTSQDFFEIEFNVNFRMCPLYIGNPDNLPDDLALVSGEDYNNTYTRLLTQILQAVGGDIQLNDNNVNIFNNGTDDVNDFVDIVQNYIPSINNFTNDMNTLPNFGNTFVNLSNYVQSVYVDIITAFPEIKWFVIMGLLVFLFGVVIR